MSRYFSSSKQIPSYLVEGRNVVSLILFTTFFSLVFVNIYRPFNSTEWLPEINNWKYLLYSSLLVIIGMGTISLSRFGMHFFVRSKKSISLELYVVWMLVEVVILSFFYVLIGLWLLPAEKLSWHDMDTVLAALKKSIANTSLMLLIPYVISILVFKIRDLERQLAEMAQMKVVGANAVEQTPSDVVEFKDERGRIGLSTKVDNVLYVESADNYVVVRYLNNSVVSELFLRNSIKKVCEDLQNTSIQRCSRSMLVNFSHVDSITKRSGELWLHLNVPDLKEIAVSRVYNDKASELFKTYSSSNK